MNQGQLIRIDPSLDGIIRLDLAHVIRGRSPRRLRVHLYFDGLL